MYAASGLGLSLHRCQDASARGGACGGGVYRVVGGYHRRKNFDLDFHLKHVDAIFPHVFGKLYPCTRMR
jgi:hypothetical protein